MLQNLIDSLTGKNKKQITQTNLKEVLDMVTLYMTAKLERHFEFYLMYDEFLCGEKFITPPAKGEFYVYENESYEVLSVSHYSGGDKPNRIVVKRLKE